MAFHKYATLYLCFTLITGSTWAQMTPNAPVKNFRMPRFADNGYTQWVLQGGKGIYDSEAQVRVEEMALRVYSGDERMAQEMTIESPMATLRIQENRALSEAPIQIVGSNFEISGTGWTWDGNTKVIEVLADAEVRFAQSFNTALVDRTQAEAVETVIQSDRLSLKTTEADYSFDFIGDVRVESGTMQLSSESLFAQADTPDGREADVTELSIGELNAVRHVLAQKDVVIVDSGRVVRSQEAEFFPREQRALLTGEAEVALETAFLSGHQIESQGGEITLIGNSETGRSQMILMQTGGLGLQGAARLDQETIVLANSITMRQTEARNEFFFLGEVEVLSGSVQLKSEQMTILADSGAADEAASSDLKMGKVQKMIAEGQVHVRNDEQVATGDQIEFFPESQRAVLTGTPRIQSGESIVDGLRMELQPKHSVITGSAENPVVVSLPAMPDMGFDPTLGVEKTTDSTVADADESAPVIAEASEVEPTPTVIKSLRLELFESESEKRFEFSNQVEVLGTNLLATCDRMFVYTSDDLNQPESSKMDKIEAFDDVRIEQRGRVATANKAEILPDEGKLVLEGEAAVEDDRGRVSGHRLTLLKGERRAVVEGGGPKGERARITLPAIPEK